MDSRIRTHTLRVGAGIAFAALLLVAPISTAQTGTPVGDAQAGDGPHPANIYLGTCDELGAVVAPLTEVADPAATGEWSGAITAHAMTTSFTLVDLPLQEIIDGGHTIAVQESAEASDVNIACGDIGGVIDTAEDGGMELNIALGELNNSGHTGIVWFGAAGEQTEVVVTLVEPVAMQ